MKDRKRHRISNRKIKKLVNEQDTEILYRMIKRYKQNSYNQNNNNNVYMRNTFNKYKNRYQEQHQENYQDLILKIS